MGWSFLKPKVSSLLITIVVFSLPTAGGPAIFQPLRLLETYWEAGEWTQLYLMILLILVIYVAASFIVEVLGRLTGKMK